MAATDIKIGLSII